MSKRRFIPTKEQYEKIRAKSQAWTNEAFDDAEAMGGTLKDNILYLCEKNDKKVIHVLRWMKEMGLNLSKQRLYTLGKLPTVYPTAVEISFFSKYFEVDPGDLISKDLREIDRLKRASKKII